MTGFLSRFTRRASDPAPSAGPATPRRPSGPSAGAAPTSASAGPAPGAGLFSFFSSDHRACDRAWGEIEREGGGAGTAALLVLYDEALRRHFAMEEDVMFPAFEQASGMSQGGPTFVMRAEHEQMRGVLDQMARAVAAGSAPKVLDLGDTLLMLVQQHNAKEEGILYPMAEQVLHGEWAEMERRLRAMPGG